MSASSTDAIVKVLTTTQLLILTTSNLTFDTESKKMMKIRVRNSNASEVNHQLRSLARRNSGVELEVESYAHNERWSEHVLSVPEGSYRDCATLIFFATFMEDYGYEWTDLAFVL